MSNLVFNIFEDIAKDPETYKVPVIGFLITKRTDINGKSIIGAQPMEFGCFDDSGCEVIERGLIDTDDYEYDEEGFGKLLRYVIGGMTTPGEEI